MSRHFFTFLGTFVLGALIALAARAAWFNPNADHTGHPSAGGDYAPMVANTPPAAGAHTAHQNVAATAPKTEHGAAHSAAPAAATVNTVCAICGMEVDPELPTAEYHGKTIGFGCKACPAKFKANPDKYGPAALRNEVVKG